MSISAIGSSSSAYQPLSTNPNLQAGRQDYQALASALQTGDVSGAQTAVSALEQLIQGGPSSSQTQGAQNPLSADLAAVDKALQSGNVASAQTAFAKLQQDMQSLHRAGGHHHHHHHAAAATDAVGSTTSSSDSSATGGNTSGSSPGAQGLDVIA